MILLIIGAVLLLFGTLWITFPKQMKPFRVSILSFTSKLPEEQQISATQLSGILLIIASIVMIILDFLGY